MKIVYFVLSHKNERQIRRLITRLRSGSNSFVLVHHDFSKGSPLTVQSAADTHVISEHVPVAWGDITVVLAMLRGIEWLEREDPAFDWLIVISGQDYPIRAIREIESSLERSSYDAFVHHELIEEDPTLHGRYYHTLCMRRYFYRRMKLPGFKPLFVRRKHPYVPGFKCFAGSQWLNLSRKAVEYLWSQKEQTADLVRYLKGTSCPDETLFQTILLNKSGLNIANNDRRFILWREDADHPELLCLEHLGAIRESDAWFARKVDDTRCPELLDRLDDLAIRVAC